MSKPSVSLTLDLLPRQVPDGANAWDALQVQLLRLAEQAERGGADIQELRSAIADYDRLRTAAGYASA
jgi:hypothetical protein